MNNDVKLVPEIVEKIKLLPFNNETTIAELINYNPEEYFVEPLIQGQIVNKVEEICRKENIYIERNIDEKGGLAFYCKFKKYENLDTKKIIDEIVNYILNMKDGEENTIKNIFNHIVNELKINCDIDLFNIQEKVEIECIKNNIILDYSKWNNAIVGFPYDVEFTKKTDSIIGKIYKIATEILKPKVNDKIIIEKVENEIYGAMIDATERGSGIVIIGSDLTYLYGGSFYGASQLLDKFKKGERTDVNMNKEFKIENFEFEDEETKIEFQKYLDAINEYNRKVANGEKPDKDLAAIANEFNERFVFDGVEKTYVEDKKFDELMEKINKKIEELNKLEDSDM